MYMKHTTGIIVIVLILIGGWYFWSEKERGTTENQDEAAVTPPALTVAVSFYPLAFAVGEIAGDLATVVNVGEGRDPHDVQLSTQDVLSLQQADLVVLQGADLEPWGDDIVEQLESEGVPVHLATAGLTLMEGEAHGDEHGSEEEEMHEEDEHEESDEDHEGENEDGNEEEHEGEDEHGEFDPHTWLDPVLFSESITHVTEAIVSVDPDNASTYEGNAAALKSKLTTLNAEYESRLARCELTEVVTSHDAFGYLGERYGFEIHAIAGISTQDLPSATTLAELKEEAEEGVGAILLEDNSVAAYGETLARETGLETLSINPIAFDIPEGGDYLTVMRSNLDTFATALKCDE